MKMKKAMNCIWLAVMAALVMSSCAGTPQQPGSEGSGGLEQSATVAAPLMVEEEGTVVKDQTRWTLPLDPYWGPRTDNLRTQATSLVLSTCMSEAGFPEYEPWWNMNAPAQENLAGNGINSFFNEELAAKYGYRLAPNPRDVKESDRVADEDEIPELSQEYLDQFTECDIKTGELLQLDWGPHINNVEDIDDSSPVAIIKGQMNQLRWETMPQDVADAASEWRVCMAPLGIPDLPSEPWEIGGFGLPQSVQDKWGGWDILGSPSAEEIELAVADAQCRRSSGWFDAYYDALWDLEERFVNEHKDDLAPLLEKNREDAKRYEEIINQHSGN